MYYNNTNMYYIDIFFVSRCVAELFETLHDLGGTQRPALALIPERSNENIHK